MGYYTNYSLTLLSEVDEKMLPAIQKEIEEMNVFEDCTGRDWHVYEIKWYDHDQDMAILSKKFPNVVFELYGQGEDSEDMWYAYYKNGFVQDCPAKITFDPYNANFLTPVVIAPDYTYSYS